MADRQNRSLESAGCTQRVTSDELKEQINWIKQRFGSAITDTGILLDNALKMGERIILEGAQGCLLDIDQGTFPFVTSSVTSRKCITWCRNSSRACRQCDWNNQGIHHQSRSWPHANGII